jgi:hypothetical protein
MLWWRRSDFEEVEGQVVWKGIVSKSDHEVVVRLGANEASAIRITVPDGR